MKNKKVIYDKSNFSVIAVFDSSDNIDIEAIAEANGKSVESFGQIETNFDRFKLEKDTKGNTTITELFENLPEVPVTQDKLSQILNDIDELKTTVQELTERLDAMSNGAE